LSLFRFYNCGKKAWRFGASLFYLQRKRTDMKNFLTAISITVLLLIPHATMAQASSSGNSLNKTSEAERFPLITGFLADTSYDFSQAAENDEIASTYAFGNPAGCAPQTEALTAEERLAKVQSQIGDIYRLEERREYYIWGGTQMVNVQNDPFVYEFVFDEFRHPFTYRGDQVTTIFLVNGFVTWFRQYNGSFRLLAIPMVDGVMQSQWAGYVHAYWQKDGIPQDGFIYPVMKKLPCHWVIDQGYVTNDTLVEMFNLNWQRPDFLSTGSQYLAADCREANHISQDKIGYWDASSMCGPLAWTIMRDANALPYGIGSWHANAGAFTSANPKLNGQPWSWFDPETYTLTRIEKPMPGYDFALHGNLQTGDIIYSYTVLYDRPGSALFDHIFLVAGVDKDGARLSISNMVRNHPYADCSIEEVKLYTPGDLNTGVINHEWNGFGYGKTGTTGFDIFRWNWVTHHLNGVSREYSVRWGDTLETIAFNWKLSPEKIAYANGLDLTSQLTPASIIILPTP
jgi:hypothetical protein